MRVPLTSQTLTIEHSLVCTLRSHLHSTVQVQLIIVTSTINNSSWSTTSDGSISTTSNSSISTSATSNSNKYK